MISSRPEWRAATLAAIVAVACAAPPEAARAQDGCGERYTVQAGDTLAAIAERCGTTVEALAAANAVIEDPARLSVGWELTVPGARASLGPEADVRPTTRDAAAEAMLAAGTYEVGPGDSFASIATELQIPMRALIAANEGVDPFGLRPGQTLRLPEAAGEDEPASGTAGDPLDAPEPQAGQAEGRASGQSGADEAARSKTSAPEARPADPPSEPSDQSARASDEVAQQMMLQGRVLSGPECPVLETPEGEIYSLVSAEYGFTPGAYVRIEGEPVDLSFCTRGVATVRVTSMSAVPAPQGG